jgi:hypothetical protein
MELLRADYASSGVACYGVSASHWNLTFLSILHVPLDLWRPWSRSGKVETLPKFAENQSTLPRSAPCPDDAWPNFRAIFFLLPLPFPHRRPLHRLVDISCPRARHHPKSDTFPPKHKLEATTNDDLPVHPHRPLGEKRRWFLGSS